MASRYAAIREAPATAVPGLALVRRLEGPAPVVPGYSARVLQRLCLYALPALWEMLLQLWNYLDRANNANFAVHIQFLLVFLFAWIAAIESFQVGRFVAANREHTGAMAILKSVCTALPGDLVASLTSVGTSSASCERLPGRLRRLPACIRCYQTIVPSNRGRATAAYPSAVCPSTQGGESAASWEFVRKEVSSHRISGAILLEDAHSSNRVVGPLSTEDLVSAIRRERVDGVLISATANDVSTLSQQIESHGGLDTPVRFIIGLPGGPSLRDRLSSDGCLYLLNTGAEPTGSMNYRLIKRAFDIVVSIVVLLSGLPVFLLIAIAVKMSSSGEIIFVQDRVGWNGRVFRMYKFRTMHTAPATESDTRWTRPNDPHRTVVGQFLRRYSLDELPQFFNVLMGDMSVVGPRPERPFFVSSFRLHIDQYHRRHRLKVGITGWAQVNGLRGDTCIRTRLLYDLYYLQNWGLVFDLKIILKTVFCVFKCKNAY